MPQTQLPPACIGRTSSRVFYLSPAEVRSYRHFGRKTITVLIVLPVALFISALSVTLFGIVGLIGSGIAGAVGISFCESWWKILKESKARTLRQATCPACNTRWNFWESAFDCPSCQHRLLQHGDMLFDITR